MLSKIIDNFITQRELNNYVLKPKTWNLADWSNPLLLANNTIAFFYYFQITGIIDFANDLNKQLAVLDCFGESIDYSKIIKIHDFGSVQQVTSDFIFKAANNISIYQPNNNQTKMFQKQYSGHIEYMLLTWNENKPQRQLLTDEKRIIIDNR